MPGPMTTQADVNDLAFWKMVQNAALTGFGSAAGLRGLVGLANIVRRNLAAPPRSATSPVAIPVPMRRAEEDEKRANMLDQAKQWTAQKGKEVSDYLGDTFAGRNQSHPIYTPLGLPAAAAATAGGAYGGWKLVDYLMDKRRKDALKKDLDQARAKYEAALFGKTAMAADLDRLYDLITQQATEKQAGDGEAPSGANNSSLPQSIADGLGFGTGAYLLGSGLLALPVARWAYEQQRKRSKTRVLEKAREENARALSAGRPTILYARPV